MDYETVQQMTEQNFPCSIDEFKQHFSESFVGVTGYSIVFDYNKFTQALNDNLAFLAEKDIIYKDSAIKNTGNTNRLIALEINIAKLGSVHAMARAYWNSMPDTPAPSAEQRNDNLKKLGKPLAYLLTLVNGKQRL